VRSGLLLTLVALLALGPLAAAADSTPRGSSGVKLWRVAYRAHDGHRRHAWIALPAWYGPHDHPAIPFVISPHGRGVTARANVRLWGALPARGSFAVISPDGEGRKLALYSWGSAGQIADLARMPQIATATLPWLRLDRSRIYAVGGSMGGQETLLLLARHPHLLAGAAALDAVTNFAQQYRDFPRLRCSKACRKTWKGPIGLSMQSLARREVGGSPKRRPLAYAERSPITYARSVAFSCVPLQLWWSVKDRIVLDPARQSAAFYDAVVRLNPSAAIEGFQGYWNHSAEMHAKARLPAVLAGFGLLPPVRSATTQLHVLRSESAVSGCGLTR
jgi:pimeloyl-ACP methyl ester carboxylesterase